MRSSGFTLIEALVTLLVFAIAVSLAAPTFSDMVQRHRASSTSNTFLAELATARTEATQRRRTVRICPRPASGTDTACSDANQGTGGCACSGTNYENGWLTYVDLNGDGTLNDNNDILLGVQAPLANNASLRRSGADAAARGTIGFNSRGSLVGTPATFALCIGDDTTTSDDDGDVLGRARFIDVALTGRAAVRAALDSETTTAAACRFGV